MGVRQAGMESLVVLAEVLVRQQEQAEGVEYFSVLADRLHLQAQVVVAEPGLLGPLQ